MLKFYSNVNPGEGLVGMYISSVNFDQLTVSAIAHYHSLFQKDEKAKNALLPSPVILMIDPRSSSAQMPLKVYYTANTFLSDIPMFCELQHSFEIENVDESGLDILNFGQHHAETLAMVAESIESKKAQELIFKQKLQNNHEYLKKNIGNLLTCLSSFESYIAEVLSGKR